ncbi:MAG TPA: hypothetical protein VL523_00120 [Terriglobia bacterium]|nr:hypothetical protein [Terriglobia bacterium]
MSRKVLIAVCFAGLVWSASHAASLYAQAGPDWAQWGRKPQHTGATPALGQSPDTQLADVTFDPFTQAEMAESGGDLLAHYQAPLVDGAKVFLEFESGRYKPCDPPGSGMPYPCGPDAWDLQIWNERAFAWKNGALATLWNFQSDWKPEPNGRGYSGLGGWEPVFHAALSNGYVFVPGFSGSIYKLNEADGTPVAHIAPFGTSDSNVFVSGPLTVDHSGNVYYNALKLDPSNPWGADVKGAWLVRVTAGGRVAAVKYTTLVPNAPASGGTSDAPCGSQRPGVNVAPAISIDGQTVYTVSRAQLCSSQSYVVAVDAKTLAPVWQTTLNQHGAAGWVADQSSSTPSVAPDGSVFYGALGGNGSRGYLMKFSSTGQFLVSYSFGWDETPAVYAHDGTYSLIIKDNHYDTGGPYYITQLSSDLQIEWQFKNTTIDRDHPDGYEWCVNAPAVDADGTVYANSEDGNVYVIDPGGTLKGNIFLRLAVGAAYTPIAVGFDGKIYTENDGDMFVVGN